jgi:drug/metabolite transporter (DMT)-like permease
MITEASIVLFLFALNPIMNKYMLQFITVKSLILFTGFAYFLVAMVLVFFMNDKTIQTDFQTLNKSPKKYLWLFIAAFPLIHMLTHYFYFSLIRDNKTYLATAIVASYPLLTAILGFLFLNESFTIIHIVGILFIIMGVSILNTF